MQPIRALVKPRVVSPYSGEKLLLEDVISHVIECDQFKTIYLTGPPGSGKSTALEYLASLYQIPFKYASVLVIRKSMVATTNQLPPGALACSLVPWGQDEIIEYLLAVWPERCKSVMGRLKPDDFSMFDGLPEIWQLVLDAMAGDESIVSAQAALFQTIDALVPPDLMSLAQWVCIELLAISKPIQRAASKHFSWFPPQMRLLLRHRVVQMFLAGGRIAADLRERNSCDFLAMRLPLDLVESVGNKVANDQSALNHLQLLLAQPARSHAMLASILCAAQPGWRPQWKITTSLAGAYLPGVEWSRVNLSSVDLSQTYLKSARLGGANLDHSKVQDADLRCADLRHASLIGWQAGFADLRSADLSNAEAYQACFKKANLTDARLDEARLNGVCFDEAALCNTSFVGAALMQASFCAADVRGADFSRGNLEGANLSGLVLREVNLSQARFVNAHLVDCDMECLHAEQVDFSEADLSGTLLTGSTLAGVSFRNARLVDAKLADIHWEGADLRGADLTGANFHLGSSRSGMVGSVIPCEGSKTGFYTDEYGEQHYKSPEEIRKANLCDADLRDAKVEDVDFYLVDLRGATYLPEQALHFRRCGAILQA